MTNKKNSVLILFLVPLFINTTIQGANQGIMWGTSPAGDSTACGLGALFALGTAGLGYAYEESKKTRKQDFVRFKQSVAVEPIQAEMIKFRSTVSRHRVAIKHWTESIDDNLHHYRLNHARITAEHQNQIALGQTQLAAAAIGLTVASPVQRQHGALQLWSPMIAIYSLLVREETPLPPKPFDLGPYFSRPLLLLHTQTGETRETTLVQGPLTTESGSSSFIEAGDISGTWHLAQPRQFELSHKKFKIRHAYVSSCMWKTGVHFERPDYCALTMFDEDFNAEQKDDDDN